MQGEALGVAMCCAVSLVKNYQCTSNMQSWIRSQGGRKSRKAARVPRAGWVQPSHPFLLEPVMAVSSVCGSRLLMSILKVYSSRDRLVESEKERIPSDEEEVDEVQACLRANRKLMEQM